MARRPAPLTVGPIHARAIRGPRADGRWYWRARRFVDGGESTPWTGWASRPEAERHLAGLVAGGTLDAAPARYSELTTVRDLLECWIAGQAERGDLRPVTIQNYRTKARHLATGLGAVRLDRLDLVAIEGHRDRRIRAEVAPASVAMELNVLRIAWTWGRAVGACPDRKLPSVDVRQRPTRNHSTPDGGDVGAVLGRLDGWARVAVLVLFATGARVGEVADLEWSAVDLCRAVVTFNGKTGARIVPLAPVAVEALASLPRKGARVFSCAGKTVRVSLGGRIARACKAAGVPAFTPHGLRRAAVDSLLRAGVDVGTACAILGHSPAVMLTHYRRATLDDARKAVVSARLGTIPAGEVLAFTGRRGA